MEFLWQSSLVNAVKPDTSRVVRELSLQNRSSNAVNPDTSREVRLPLTVSCVRVTLPCAPIVTVPGETDIERVEKFGISVSLTKTFPPPVHWAPITIEVLVVVIVATVVGGAGV